MRSISAGGAVNKPAENMTISRTDPFTLRLDGGDGHRAPSVNMKQTTTYSLIIETIPTPYDGDESTEHSQPIDRFDDAITPFGPFHVGDTLQETGTFLGRIEHIHHAISKSGKDTVREETTLFLYKHD
jgi:hypothetical protein